MRTPKLWKEPDLQIQDTNKTSNYLSGKRLPPRHILFKLSKVNDKERIIKASREWEMERL